MNSSENSGSVGDCFVTPLALSLGWRTLGAASWTYSRPNCDGEFLGQCRPILNQLPWSAMTRTRKVQWCAMAQQILLSSRKADPHRARFCVFLSCSCTILSPVRVASDLCCFPMMEARRPDRGPLPPMVVCLACSVQLCAWHALWKERIFFVDCFLFRPLRHKPRYQVRLWYVPMCITLSVNIRTVLCSSKNSNNPYISV